MRNCTFSNNGSVACLPLSLLCHLVLTRLSRVYISSLSLFTLLSLLFRRNAFPFICYHDVESFKYINAMLLKNDFFFLMNFKHH